MSYANDLMDKSHGETRKCLVFMRDRYRLRFWEAVANAIHKNARQQARIRFLENAIRRNNPQMSAANMNASYGVSK